MRVGLAFVVVVAACGGKAAPPRIAEDPPCVKVAHHMVDLMAPKDGAIDTAKTINDMIVERCEGDKWSPDAQHCLLDMQSLDDNTKCEDLLTVGQREALANEIDQKLPRKPAEPPKRETKETEELSPDRTRSPRPKGGDPCEGGQ